ncbi:MAG TPA: 5-formyltetrahydrofolate cyclo-ligase [Cytophagaceae bacterium]|jgi:5-formyltetrahydrofolate cyclo-ligase
MNKADLRSAFITKRKLISPELAHQYSEKIADSFLFSFPEASTKIIHCYLPIAAKREVDTLILINRIFEVWPDSTIVVPKSNMLTCDIENYIFTKDSEVILNAWNIPEPVACEFCTPAMIDYVITPLLAYDEKGNRVGYGKGFYDRFFAKCRKDVIKVGLCFFEPTAAIDDVDAHDVRLDYCVTPDRVYRF